MNSQLPKLHALPSKMGTLHCNTLGIWKKVSVTGAGRLQEHKNTKFVWDLRKTGFCRGRSREYDFCLRLCLLWVTSMCLCNIHYMYASAIGTECVKIYAGYHIPPNITQCVTQAKCEVTKIIRFHCFKAMSLVRLAHGLFSRRVSFWFLGVCMILGQLWSLSLDCMRSLPVFVCSWLCSSGCSFLLFPSPIAVIDGFST